jgi:hypothetical protein
MANQGGVGEQEKRFGNQRPERRNGQAQDVAIKFSGDA